MNVLMIMSANNWKTDGQDNTMESDPVSTEISRCTGNMNHTHRTFKEFGDQCLQSGMDENEGGTVPSIR